MNSDRREDVSARLAEEKGRCTFHSGPQRLDRS